jgi:hypothetical protein
MSAPLNLFTHGREHALYHIARGERVEHGADAQKSLSEKSPSTNRKSPQCAIKSIHQQTRRDHWSGSSLGRVGSQVSEPFFGGVEYSEVRDEEEEEEFYIHYKNDLKRHAHTPSGVAGADL